MSARFRAAFLLTIAAVVGLLGCSRSITLDVGYPDAGVNRAMLAAARPRRVDIRPVVDRRADTARIGVQRADGDKPIVTSRAVADIVREALVSEVQKNGHAVAADNAELVLAADVDEFWLDAVAAYASVHYVGKVALSVAVVDARTGDTLVTRRYVGIRRQQAKRDDKQAGLEVMDIALSRALHDLATDAELAEAFGARLPRVRHL